MEKWVPWRCFISGSTRMPEPRERSEEYFSASGMNDHHFHYGYADGRGPHRERDPDWLSPEQWGEMVNLIARDIATSERAWDDFPFVRNLTVYEGHQSGGKRLFWSW